MSLNTNTLPTASDLSSEKRSVCLINDSFPPVIDGVANAVTNYASIIQRSFGDATVVTPYYPDADDSIYPFRCCAIPVSMPDKAGWLPGRSAPVPGADGTG